MCYNCGNNLPDDNDGNSDNITTETFVKAAKASGISLEEAMENTYKLLKQSFGNEQEPLNNTADSL